jgi:hypothetical protein
MPVNLKVLSNLAEASYNSKFENYLRLSVETESQKAAICQTFAELLSTTQYTPKEIWSAIHAAHLKRKSGRAIDLTEDDIAAVVSAHQSWIKSGGHAAEDFWKEKVNAHTGTSGIQVLLQRDVSLLMNQRAISNPPLQLNQLKEWLASSSFDLYAVSKNGSQVIVFGCIQSKTSIRDRVTREREPSNQAMDFGFWSIALVIDGEFLRLEKFKTMVNGGTAIFPRNGWHAMYALDVNDAVGRIIKLDRDLSNFMVDAKKALEHFEGGGGRFATDY